MLRGKDRWSKNRTRFEVVGAREKKKGNYLLVEWKFEALRGKARSLLVAGGWTLLASPFCRQGYGNKIIRGWKGGWNRNRQGERERARYSPSPVADRMRNDEKEKGTGPIPLKLLRNRVNSRSAGVTSFKRYVRLSPIKFFFPQSFVNLSWPPRDSPGTNLKITTPRHNEPPPRSYRFILFYFSSVPFTLRRWLSSEIWGAGEAPFKRYKTRSLPWNWNSKSEIALFEDER